MLSNMSRKADEYGNIHFVSLYGAILSRLAYNNDNTFFTNYNKIFGPVILPNFLKGMSDAKTIQDLLDDENVLGLKKSHNLIPFTYQFEGKTFLAFDKVNITRDVNEATGEVKGTVKANANLDSSGSMKYISIGWSNYGEVYVIADKRMPNMINVIFRGTYSAKTAGLYSKPTSLTPLGVGCSTKEGFLYGIFKPTIEMMHTIIEAATYLATNFLGATGNSPLKVFTSGHSLGGAMCTNFAYIYNGLKKMSPYNAAPYDVLGSKIICVSLGAPRGVGGIVAKKMCDKVRNGEIVFLRITTRGDPVPALPPKSGYEHPCSSDAEMRKQVSEDCNANLTTRTGKVSITYKSPLDCQSFKTRPYAPNPLSHTVYLNILYTNAVDIVNFLKGVGMSKEVAKINGNTGCRIIVGSSSGIKAGFFDASQVREDGFSKTQKLGGPVNEDVKMNNASFSALIQKIEGSSPLSGNLSPMDPPPGSVISGFISGSPMPKFSCVNETKQGGRRRKTKNRKNTKRLTRTRKYKKKASKKIKRSRKVYSRKK